MSDPQTRPIRVLIVDDHKSFAWGVSKLIDGERPGMEVVGKAFDRASALALTRSERPDVVLLDIALGPESSLDFLPQLLDEAPSRVLILTGEENPAVHERAVELGASGVVLKAEEPEVILRAIEKVHQGELWLDRAATARVFAKLARGGNDRREVDGEAFKMSKLTPKEREVIRALSQTPGNTTEEIAARLNMSPKTLTNHLTSIYSNLGIEPPNSRLKLFMYAKAHGLDRPAS